MRGKMVLNTDLIFLRETGQTDLRCSYRWSFWNNMVRGVSIFESVSLRVCQVYVEILCIICIWGLLVRGFISVDHRYSVMWKVWIMVRFTFFAAMISMPCRKNCPGYVLTLENILIISRRFLQHVQIWLNQFFI